MKFKLQEPANCARNYPLNVRWSEEDQAFIGSVVGLVGDCCHGDTPAEVISHLQDIAEDLVAYLLKEGQTLPLAPSDNSDPDPSMIRSAMGISQSKFAKLIGVSIRTLHKWEQHTSRPSGAARALLKVAATNPNAVRQALHATS
jgi:putative transcriptional regulator